MGRQDWFWIVAAAVALVAIVLWGKVDDGSPR